ncbi:MAG: sialidase family protein [Solirubrobacteraceae bacterium]
MRRVATAALILVGAAILLAAQLVSAGEPARVDGADRPVSVGAGDLGDITAHNSPTLVRNPRDGHNLVVTSRIDSPDFSCAVHASLDGGRHWTRTPVPVPRGAGRTCFAPDAAFGSDGRLRVSYVTLQGVGNRPQAVWLASSRDGGRTLQRPHRISGPLAFQVRITADPGNSRRLYATWVQARDVGLLKFTGPGNPVLASRSDDGGVTWGRPVRVNRPSRGSVLAPSADVGRNGELYVLFLDVGADRLDYDGGHRGEGGPPYEGRFSLVLARSLDRGASWQESVVDHGVVPTRRFIAFLPPFPSLAVDRARGRLYVAFEDARLGTPDVYVWSLAPGSARWSRPVRVNDTPTRDASWQYLPELSVAPGGRVDVVYYDRRAGGRSNLRNEVSLQSSDDGAATFGPRLNLTSQSFDSRVGAGGEQGLPDLGSRLGLASDDRSATAVWSDTRAGTDASHKQDLRSARALVDGPEDGSNLRNVLLLTGVVLLVAGCLVAVGGRRLGVALHSREKQL